MGSTTDDCERTKHQVQNLITALLSEDDSSSLVKTISKHVEGDLWNNFYSAVMLCVGEYEKQPPGTMIKYHEDMPPIEVAAAREAAVVHLNTARFDALGTGQLNVDEKQKLSEMITCVCNEELKGFAPEAIVQVVHTIRIVYIDPLTGKELALEDDMGDVALPQDGKLKMEFQEEFGTMYLYIECADGWYGVCRVTTKNPRDLKIEEIFEVKKVPKSAALKSPQYLHYFSSGLHRIAEPGSNKIAT